MAFRFRKSKKLGPVTVTASKGGIGMSLGGKGARIGVGADGRKKASVGIPGTGISFQKAFGARRKKSAAKNLLVLAGLLFLFATLLYGACKRK